MRVCVLGISAGGGLPQWNCRCANCLTARNRGDEKLFHSQASIAVSASGRHWCLINAAPDITQQIERFHSLQPRVGMRSTPITTVFLTDAELDHTLGLLALRQNSVLNIYAPHIVVDSLTNSFPLRRIVKNYATHCWRGLNDEEQIILDDEGLRVTVISVGTKLPRYVKGSHVGKDATVAYFVEDMQSGSTLLYAPSVQQWTERLESASKLAHCIMIDGTFWSDDELIQLHISDRTASDMGHLPLTGHDGILNKVAKSPAKNKFLVHVNNTNNILSTGSKENQVLMDHGVRVAPERCEIIV